MTSSKCSPQHPASVGALDIESLQAQLQLTLPMGRIEISSLPGCPGIRLGLINADFPTGPLPEEVMHAVLARPAYWAFCWGSGLALARLLARNPHWVRGRRVLDLGCGSGVVAIAAALNGARAVMACDNDPDARLAAATNAALNGVALELLEHFEALTEPCDLVIMADFFYDCANLELLEGIGEAAPASLIAESRLGDIPLPGYRLVASDTALTYPNLGEFDAFRHVRVFYGGSGGPGRAASRLSHAARPQAR